MGRSPFLKHLLTGSHETGLNCFVIKRLNSSASPNWFAHCLIEPSISGRSGSLATDFPSAIIDVKFDPNTFRFFGKNKNFRDF